MVIGSLVLLMKPQKKKIVKFVPKPKMWKKWLPNEMYVTKPGENLNRLKINIR